MDLFKKEKKQWKKGLKRAKRPFKPLSVLAAIGSVICVGAFALDGYMLNAFTCMIGDTTGKIVNYDEKAQYYKVDFNSVDEQVNYENALVEKIETEGATLLKNDGALPLMSGNKVSCFSTSSVNLVYGGTGSGAVDSAKAPTLKNALTAEGLKVNPDLWNFYKSGEGKKYKRQNGNMAGGQSAIGEAPWSAYSYDVLKSIESYSDAAIVVLSRIGGEGADLETRTSNYLALDENEKSMLEGIGKLKKEGKIKKVIVLLNTSNAIQLDFMKNEDYGIDSLMWIGGVGATGINGVAKLLTGREAPSGSLVDTFLYDNLSSPAMVNFNTQEYVGAEKAGLNDNQKYYVVYQEGIYLGYKYYETRYEDQILKQGNAGNFAYDEQVAYPFGYGMSYTQFEYSDMGMSYDANTDEFTVTVTVKNTGNMTAKKSVQLYLQSPYTEYDKANNIEKSAVSLCGFEKTGYIDPGKEEKVTIKVDKRELASYDAYGAKTYILEQGDYYFTIGNGSHEATNNILAMKGANVDGDKTLVSAYTQSNTDTVTYSTSKNGTVISNLFDDADLNLYEGASTKIDYLSRKDWTGTYPKKAIELAVTERLKSDLSMQKHEITKTSVAELPVTGKEGYIRAYDMIGVPFEDKQWADFIDQMTVDEMVNFVSNAFHLTYAVESIQLPQTRQENGPQGYTGFFGLGNFEAMAITSCDILAATFNRDIAKEVGRCIGNDCLADGISALYGPGSNIHRTPYSGRNFEYYSEDGFLSGEIGSVENAAITEKGVMVEVKHFVLNDCEENRYGLGTWTNEQALREIYLKGFQKIFEVTPMAGVMNGYDRLGTVWCGANKSLLTDLLRGEWGSMGFIITDNATSQYMNGIDGVIAGSCLFDAMMPFAKGHLSAAKQDATVINALKQACHYNIYAIVNSSAMNGIGANTTIKVQAPVHNTVLNILAIAFPVLFVAFTTLSVLRGKKYKKENPKPVK